MSGNKKLFCLSHDIARARAIDAVRDAPKGYVVRVEPPTRTVEQNDRMWALLTEVAEQVDWHGQKLSKEEWKDVFTAALKRQKVVPGLDGGFVVLGSRTSKMPKAEISDLMELISAFAAERGVEMVGAG